jgi:hypothetical protein
MQRLKLAISGLIAIAATIPHTASEQVAQKHTADPMHVSADANIINQDPVILLRSVTIGMRRQGPLLGPASENQVALAAPKGAGPVKSDESAPKPESIVIDVLVAYTKKAASKYSDIRQELLDFAIDETNRSFALSHIGHIRLQLVHAYQTDYVEEGEHFDHVWRFADRGDGYMDEVHGLRDLYRADIALLVVDDPKGCGLATRVHADADDAFAVVHHACASTDYTIAHEVGHLIGARHELSYVSGTKWRDIMGLKERCGGCPRVPVWSSPTVLVNGEVAGTAEFNNARVIAEQAGRVAAFR